ncbi:F-box/WD repeat-containing protein pof1 [Sporormia fimetaria CBS 119925]|uniref:F-box/WD repeat-containing protein pof1 n=1 Tax=Sporormia fimetaria CBS 119925 TaxID=1340428 RepID=A0A6A6V022_9PLEO|nr:F-box/WD repeat-containing protein pof1 [Sporormia fimetaria CBS 119925]
MASDTFPSGSAATELHTAETPRRHSAWRTTVALPLAESSSTSASPSALLPGHGHETPLVRSRNDEANTAAVSDETLVNKSATKSLNKMITPYLTQYIPKQYNPIGAGAEDAPLPSTNTAYCYRHRPDMLCRKQADEPTMEQLQKELARESQQDQQSIANVWSLFSAAPAKHRNLMLQGILAQCCFPQLSFISSSVRNLIKIDFLSALPPELGFKILCYLDTTSLCKAAQVSRRWRTLADDDVVWHKMCEQHIDRKCTKCGWGLPLLDQRRLRTEKRRIQLRASGQGLNEFEPELTSLSAVEDPQHAREPSPDVSVGSKRSAPGSPFSPELSAKRICSRNGDSTHLGPPKKRPWKDVYKARFKVGTNWKYGRYSTMELKEHENGVMCLQFDDRILMTGSYDATVKIWDLKTGKVIRTLTGHTQGIRCLQFDDGGRLITGSLDHTIKVWNWRTGQLLKTLNVHTRGVIGVHMADKLLASGSADNTIVVHDFSTYKRFTLTGHTDWVNSVRIDIPSRTLFSASDDCTVKLWDLDTNTCLKTFEGHVAQVQTVLPLPADFELDESDLINTAHHDYTSDSASQSSSTRDRSATPELRQTSSSDNHPLFWTDPTRPSPPSYMLTGSLDGTIRLWHIPTGRCVHRFFGHVEGVWGIAADSLRLVSGAEDKTIKIWDPRTGKCERTLTGHTGPVTCVGLSDSRLVSGSEDGTVRVCCFFGEEGKS